MKHYKHNLIWMKLGILKDEVIEVEDEVAEVEMDVKKVMLKRAWIKPSSRIGMAVVKKGAKEISPS